MFGRIGLGPTINLIVNLLAVAAAAIEGYARGFDAYAAGERRQAMQRWEEVLAACADDQPAALMIERCRRLLAAPPARWDGVVEME
jgi:hypothetical protein